MNRLARITDALSSVVDARQHCPFHPTYFYNQHHRPNDACKECGAGRSGDGGTCVIAHAEHKAVLAIEEALA